MLNDTAHDTYSHHAWRITHYGQDTAMPPISQRLPSLRLRTGELVNGGRLSQYTFVENVLATGAWFIYIYRIRRVRARAYDSKGGGALASWSHLYRAEP